MLFLVYIFMILERCGSIGQCQRRRWQIATGIYNTGDEFATGVNDIGGKQWEQLSNC